MKVLTYPLGELQANCYFLIQDKDCVIIDPGDSSDFILEEVSRQNLNVKAIIATHGHFDHVMAVGELQASLDAPFYISSKDQFLLDRVEETAKHFLGHVPIIIPSTPTSFPRKRESSSGSPIKLGMTLVSFNLELIETPGHTPGSVCFYIKEESTLLTGDTLFKDGIGRYDFSYSNKKQLLGSIKHLIETLPEETLVYAGHGEITTLGEESKNLSQFF